MSVVKLENVTLSYDRHPAVHQLCGEFSAGSLTAIAGPNGAGKSTLLKGIAGLLKPEEGAIVIEDAKSIAYLPQAAELQRDFPMSVEEMVATGLWRKAGMFGGISKAQREKVLEAIEAVGLQGFSGRTLDTLSIGQFQRALFARLLIQDAKIILLDEPFNAIDADTTQQLLQVVRRWHHESRTVICVLHDFAQIREFFPHCLLLARECVAWGPSRETLHPEKLLQARFFRPVFAEHADACAPHVHDHEHPHEHHPS